jgi:Lar family restriction alleviation protein
MEKLKPCPFCGKEGELFSHEAPLALGGGTRYMVVCSRCFGRAGNADTRDGAIKMWNRRSGYETN